MRFTPFLITRLTNSVKVNSKCFAKIHQKCFFFGVNSSKLPKVLNQKPHQNHYNQQHNMTGFSKYGSCKLNTNANKHSYNNLSLT